MLPEHDLLSMSIYYRQSTYTTAMMMALAISRTRKRSKISFWTGKNGMAFVTKREQSCTSKR
jgi:hypothetical protein